MRSNAAKALNQLYWKPATVEQRAYWAMARCDFEACVSEGAVTLEAILVALNDSDWSVQSKAAQALGDLGNPRAVDPLIRALRDSDESVRSAAAGALRKLVGIERLIETLVDIALRHHCYSRRCGAAWELGKLRDPRAVEPLIRALRDSDVSVRLSANEALSKLGLIRRGENA